MPDETRGHADRPAIVKTPGRIFHDASPAQRRVFLPWKQAVYMCWASVRNRRERFVLVLLGIMVVVAFLVSTYVVGEVFSRLARIDDPHVQAVLARAGVSAIADATQAQGHDRHLWLIVLSGALCLFGITNTMLMSVTERFAEIGTLKCLGALDRFVVRLILLESTFIGFLGGLAGALIGCALALAQAAWTVEPSLLTFDICAGPFVQAIVVAAVMGTFLTVAAGAYPAYVAARMEPVEAMRSEI